MPDEIATLEELLASLFAENELRQFIGNLPYKKNLKNDLPGPGITHNSLALATQELLARHGLINTDLFIRLKNERPNRRVDINRVQTLILKQELTRQDDDTKRLVARPPSDLNNGPDEGRWQSTFMSYGGPDANFAQKPHDALHHSAGRESPDDDERGQVRIVGDLGGGDKFTHGDKVRGDKHVHMGEGAVPAAHAQAEPHKSARTTTKELSKPAGTAIALIAIAVGMTSAVSLIGKGCGDEEIPREDEKIPQLTWEEIALGLTPLCQNANEKVEIYGPSEEEEPVKLEPEHATAVCGPPVQIVFGGEMG